LLFSESDGIFRRSAGTAGFHFDKHQLIAVPCNQIHFTAADAVSRSNHTESESAQVSGAIDFGAPSECKQAAPPHQTDAAVMASSRMRTAQST
jgi:hypothetical protein